MIISTLTGEMPYIAISFKRDEFAGSGSEIMAKE